MLSPISGLPGFIISLAQLVLFKRVPSYDLILKEFCWISSHLAAPKSTKQFIGSQFCSRPCVGYSANNYFKFQIVFSVAEEHWARFSEWKFKPFFEGFNWSRSVFTLFPGQFFTLVLLTHLKEQRKHGCLNVVSLFYKLQKVFWGVFYWR